MPLRKKYDLIEGRERRVKVQDLFLKSIPATEIAKQLNETVRIIKNDITYWKTYYSQLALNNPQLAEKQYAQVQQLVDEVAIIKKEYWELYDDVKQQAAHNKEKYLKNKEEIQKLEKEMTIQIEAEERGKVKKLQADIDRLLRQKLPSHVKTRLDALGSIITRIEKESKLLTLFSPANVIKSNYVSSETLMSIMVIFKTIINDLVDPAKQKDAFKRMQKVDLGKFDNIVDAEFKPEK